MKSESSPWILLIGGGHASGKKTLSDNVKKCLQSLSEGSKDCPIHVSVVNLDAVVTENAHDRYNPKGYIFPKMVERVLEPSKTIGSIQVVIAYGKYALYDSKLRDLAALKVFIDGDGDIRLSRWILRDTKGDSSKLEPILTKYLTYARPEMIEYIQSTRQYADVILPDAAREHTDSSVNLLSVAIYDRIRLIQGSLSHSNVALLNSPSLGPQPVPNLIEEGLDRGIQRYVELS